MTYFNNPTTLQELRQQYRDLAKQYHPDVSGSDTLREMQAINDEFDRLSASLASGMKHEASELEFSQIFKDKIAKLIKTEGLVIEIIGNWLWISGNTFANRAILKDLDFKYAPKKKAWYFKTYKFYKRGSEKSLDDIRATYGSHKVNPEKEKRQKQSSGFLF